MRVNKKHEESEFITLPWRRG